MSALLIDHTTVRDFATNDERLTQRGWRMVGAFGTHRDADAITESNHRVMLARLAEIDPEEQGHGVMHVGHWAVGWYDHVIVNPARKDLVAVLQWGANSIEDYPLLCEDDHSELEMEWHDDGRCGEGCGVCEVEKQERRAMRRTLFAAGVLASAYRGKVLEDRALLRHAVSDRPLAVGRLSREYGEALCDRKLNMVDAGAWESPDAVTCERCLEIVARIGGGK